MADKRIQQYPAKPTPATNDYLLLADSEDVDVNGFLKYKKVQLSDLGSNLVITYYQDITYANLLVLISSNSLSIGRFYRITDSGSSVNPIIVQAVGLGYLSKIGVGSNSGTIYYYNVSTDSVITPPIPIGLGTSNQVLGVNNGATAQEYKTVQGTTNEVEVTHTANTITIGLPNATTISGANTAGSFIKSGGVSSQFLKADGSVDSNTYLTSIEGIAAGGELEGNYASPTLKNSSVIGKVLTGLSVSGSAVLSTDSILTGIGKLQNQVNALVGGVKYQGSWNASTNNPALTSSVGTAGYYYVVSVPGSTNLNGITSWELGDWAIFNGSTWQKVDNTDAVVSVNGYTGIVTLSAADVSAVPYTGATTNVDLGTHSLTASDLVINHASGSGVAASITKGGAGEALTVVKSSGSGNAASITGGTTLISTLSVTGDGVVTGNLTVDSGTLFVDATNNRVAIGSYAGGAGTIPTNNKLYLQGAGGSGTAIQNRIDIGFNDNPTFSSFIGVENPDFSNTTLVLGTQSSGVSTSALWIRNGNTQIGSRTPTAGAEKLQVTGSVSISSTLAVTGAVTLGTALAISSGGTGLTATPTNGQIDIGNGTGFTRATITGTANQVTVTNASGSITLSLPQSIATSSTPQFDKLGIGTSSLTGYNIRVNKSITGATTASNIFSQGQIQSDVTANVGYFESLASTQAAVFTLTNLYHFKASVSSFGAGSTVTNQFGYIADSSIVGGTNNFGFYGNIPSATGRWNLYMNGTASNYLAGALGIGTNSLQGSSLTIGKAITGATTVYNVTNSSTIQSDVTSNAQMYRAEPTTATSAFTIATIINYQSGFGTKGVGSTITEFIGFNSSDSSVATNTYGFKGNVTSGTNKWNLYMSGSAVNYLNGNLQLGSTTATAGAEKLQVTGTASITSTLSSGAFTSTIATAGASNVIGYFNNTDYTAGNKSAIRVRQQTGISTGYSAYLGMDGSTLFLSSDTMATKHLAITTAGAATFSSSVAIGNTVTASVATPSTHKVTMVIGGVTYYLLATNV